MWIDVSLSLGPAHLWDGFLGQQQRARQERQGLGLFLWLHEEG